MQSVQTPKSVSVLLFTSAEAELDSALWNRADTEKRS